VSSASHAGTADSTALAVRKRLERVVAGGRFRSHWRREPHSPNDRCDFQLALAMSQIELDAEFGETPRYYWRGSPGSSNILRLLGPRLVDIRRRARPPLLRGKNSPICGIIDDAA